MKTRPFSQILPKTKEFWTRSGAGESYDREFASLVGWYVNESETRPFRDLVAGVKGAKVLDVGCGTGRHLALFDQANELNGVDLSAEMLAEARKKVPNAKFFRGSGSTLPFSDGSFDLVISVRVLQHVLDQEKMVREMARVAKPGAKIILLSYNAWSLLCAYKQLRMSRIGRVLNIPFKRLLGRRSFLNPWGFDYDNYCSLPELAGWMKGCGLAVRKTWGVTCGQPWFWNDFFIGKILEKTMAPLLKLLFKLFLFIDQTLARVFPLKYFMDKIIVMGVKKG